MVYNLELTNTLMLIIKYLDVTDTIFHVQLFILVLFAYKKEAVQKKKRTASLISLR